MYSSLLLPLIGFFSVVAGSISDLPGLPCDDHRDCTSVSAFYSSVPFGQWLSLCKWGQCESLLTGKKCSNINDCGFFHSCSDGQCVLGGVGERCRIDSVNCAVGHSCDAKTEHCVRGVQGVKCRDTDGCGFGHSCNLEYPLPNDRTKRVGVCRLGTLGTDHCIRDSQCEGDMLCRPFTESSPGAVFTRYQCSKPADYSASRFPDGFAPCATDYECMTYYGTELSCIQGRCQPLSLGMSCKFDFYASNRQCSMFTACVNGTCAYAREGDTCWSEIGGMNTQCAPGLQCTAPRDQGVGKEGKCVPGVVGSKCFDGEDCASDLVCGTFGKCAHSAEGQLCRSDFYCPSHLVCNKKTNTCHPPHTVPATQRFPEVERSMRCRTSVDCPFQSSCKNGICLPKALGWECRSNNKLFEGTTCINGLEVEGTLGKTCRFSSQCYIGHSCENGTCHKSALGSPCNRDINCPPHLSCGRANKCVQPQRGERCRSDKQCARGLNCIKAFDANGVGGLCA